MELELETEIKMHREMDWNGMDTSDHAPAFNSFIHSIREF
jgi:hypothetical protein